MFRLITNIGGSFDLYVSPAASIGLRNAAPALNSIDSWSENASVAVDQLRYSPSADYGRARRILLLSDHLVEEEEKKRLKAQLESHVGTDFDRVMLAQNREEVDREAERIFYACNSLDPWSKSPDVGGVRSKKDGEFIRGQSPKPAGRPRSDSKEAQGRMGQGPIPWFILRRYLLVGLTALVSIALLLAGWAYVHHIEVAHSRQAQRMERNFVNLYKEEEEKTRKELEENISILYNQIKLLDERIRAYSIDIASDRGTGAEAPESKEGEQLKLSKETRKEIQRRLMLLGYYGRVANEERLIDGVFGGGTRRAIEAYQRKEGFPRTGYLNQEQVNRLMHVGIN